MIQCAVEPVSHRENTEARSGREGDQDSEESASAQYWMDLNIIFASSWQLTRCCKGPATAMTECLLAAMTAVSATRRKKALHEEWSVSACGFGKRCDLSSRCDPHHGPRCCRILGQEEVQSRSQEVGAIAIGYVPRWAVPEKPTAEEQHFPGWS